MRNKKENLQNGICEICGKPGHIRHHPGASATGEWCDFHYRMLALFHPYSRIGCLFWSGVIIILLILGFWIIFA